MSIMTKICIALALALVIPAQASALDQPAKVTQNKTDWNLKIPIKKIKQEQQIKLSKKLSLMRTDHYVVSVEPTVRKDVYTHQYVKRKSEKFYCLTLKITY